MEKHCTYQCVYNSKQRAGIAEEFKRLAGNCYLDHAGATLYSEKQVHYVFKELASKTFANPHARSHTSKETEDYIDIIRYEILAHFNTTPEEYSVIFTSGATQALKLVGESFEYDAFGVLAHLQNNHTSVLGMRTYAPKSVEVNTQSAAEAFQLVRPERTFEKYSDSNNLFVYPGECNFSGTKFPLNWIEDVRQGALNELVASKSHNWYVLLDAASLAGTSSINLKKFQPDFMAISFYKMFGYPTGLGALLVKKGSEKVLGKRYFGGGTVFMALSSENVMIPRAQVHERFEDGTLPFLSIVAIKHGFETIRRLNLDFNLIADHTFSLAQYVYRNLEVLHHFNGRPLAILYHDTHYESSFEQGGIINFNLLRANGEFIGYSEVLQMANLNKIHLRTGCFCNPGACQRFLRLTSDDVREHYDAGHVCGDQHDLIDNYPTGSVRISFGYMSTKQDADHFLNVIRNFFVEKPIITKFPNGYKNVLNVFKGMPAPEIVLSNENAVNSGCLVNNCGVLDQIFLYPIKSCGAFSVADKWPITSTGLKFDRQWMIINSSGVAVTQKHNTKLCLVKPTIDLDKNLMKISFHNSSLDIPLDVSGSITKSLYPCRSKVCQEPVEGYDCGEEVASFLSKVLKTPGLRLLQHSNSSGKQRTAKYRNQTALSLVNKAQYLLINTSSIHWLKDRIPDRSDEPIDSIIARFRPNFVVTFQEPFQENEFNEYVFGNNFVFKSAGKCTRCQMICIDQNTGESSKEPLATLSREFKGKIAFGLYLNNENIDDQSEIQLRLKVIGENSL